jgi:hypothetical protein
MAPIDFGCGYNVDDSYVLENDLDDRPRYPEPIVEETLLKARRLGIEATAVVAIPEEKPGESRSFRISLALGTGAKKMIVLSKGFPSGSIYDRMSDLHKEIVDSGMSLLASGIDLSSDDGEFVSIYATAKAIPYFGAMPADIDGAYMACGMRTVGFVLPRRNDFRETLELEMLRSRTETGKNLCLGSLSVENSATGVGMCVIRCLKEIGTDESNMAADRILLDLMV